MSKLKVLGMLLGILLLLSGCMVFEPIGPEVLYERDFNSDKDWSATGDGLWDMWIGDGAFHVLVKVEDLSVVSTLQAGDLADFQLVVPAIDFQLCLLTSSHPVEVELVNEGSCFETFDVIDLPEAFAACFRLADLRVH